MDDHNLTNSGFIPPEPREQPPNAEIKVETALTERKSLVVSSKCSEIYEISFLNKVAKITLSIPLQSESSKVDAIKEIVRR